MFLIVSPDRFAEPGALRRNAPDGNSGVPPSAEHRGVAPRADSGVAPPADSAMAPRAAGADSSAPPDASGVIPPAGFNQRRD